MQKNGIEKCEAGKRTQQTQGKKQKTLDKCNSERTKMNKHDQWRKMQKHAN